jgi:hypothetical protein
MELMEKFFHEILLQSISYKYQGHQGILVQSNVTWFSLLLNSNLIQKWVKNSSSETSIIHLTRDCLTLI